ncbi:MAG: phage holin family protein [Polaribacter sp.]
MSLFKFLSLSASFNDGVDKGKKYVNTTVDYCRLKTFHIVTLSISTIAKIMIIGGFLIVGLLFLSFAVAMALGDYFENPALGYVIVGGFFFLIAIIIYIFRKKIDAKVISKLGDKFSK